MLMSKLFYHTISDKQWEIIEQHLPKPKRTGRPGLNSRKVFNAILWILESKWRCRSSETGTAFTINFVLGANWVEKILQSLVDNCRKFYLVEKDSTFCRSEKNFG